MKYTVSVPKYLWLSIEVEAEDEESAMEKARDCDFDFMPCWHCSQGAEFSDDLDWNLVEVFTEGKE